MDVIAFDPYWDEAFAETHHINRCESMDEVLVNADIVSLHCPLTEQTQGLVNATRLAAMKPDAYVINTGRGPGISLYSSVSITTNRVC